MKKTLVILATVATMAVQSYADGTVLMDNYSGLVDSPVIYNGAPAPMAGTFVEILAGSAGGALTSLKVGELNAEPGYFDFGGKAIPGVADNGMADIIVRAWLGSAGSIWSTAALKSPEYKVTQAAGAWNPSSVPPAPITGSTMKLAGPIVIPEPSIIALALLGGAALFLRRRS